MGKRVQTVLCSQDNQVIILFTNTTSFDVMEVVSSTIQRCKDIEEISSELQKFTEHSEIAQRIEGFTLDDSPFGDFESIVFVQEKEDKNFSLIEIGFYDYSTSKNVVQAAYDFIDFDEVEKSTSNLINYNFEDKFLSIICIDKNYFFIESKEKLEQIIYKAIGIYQKYSKQQNENSDLIIHVDTKYDLKDTMSFLNTDDHSGETIATIDFEEGISVDIQYFDTGVKTSLKMFIFLRSGEGDYVPLEGNFSSIQDCIDYFKNWTMQDLKDELE